MNQDKELRLQAERARMLYRAGEMEREEAEKLIQPYLDAVNEMAKEIAAKYNQKPRKAFFGSYVR